jgi:hypothetical protein
MKLMEFHELLIANKKYCVGNNLYCQDCPLCEDCLLQDELYDVKYDVLLKRVEKVKEFFDGN